MADPCNDCKAHAAVDVLISTICKKVDEVRTQLSSHDWVGRTEVDLKLKSFEMRVDALERILNRKEGGKQWSDVILIALIAGAVTLMFHYVFKF